MNQNARVPQRNFQPKAQHLLFALACLLLSACSPVESRGYDYVEVTEDGSIVVGQDGWDEGVRVVLESSDLETWQREPGQSGVEWERTTESCNPTNPQVCIELGMNSQINVSTDGGNTFETEWQVDDGAHWTPGRQGSEFFSGDPFLFEATDIAWTDDGRALIAMSDRYPVVRNADGSFTPSIADLHPYPMVSVAFIIGSWVAAAVGLMIIGNRRSERGVVGFAVASLSFFAVGVFIQFDLLGLLASAALFFGGSTAFAVALFRALSSPPAPRAPDQADQTTSALRLVWPVPALLALGYAWDIDLLPWFVMSAVMFAVIAVAVPLARPQATTEQSKQLKVPAHQ